MDKTPQKLFLYSSLRSGFQNPAYAYISKYFILEAEARVKGKLFDLGNNIVGIPSEEDYYVKGELYRISNSDEFSWALAQLDDYEGLQNDDGEIPLYTRLLTTVYTDNGETAAWVYWYNRPVISGQFIESGDILAFFKEKK
jgi:gamma-glutamylcyclotransferase (GGCT)/AIG2-like uncharacterized protein YtfP